MLQNNSSTAIKWLRVVLYAICVGVILFLLQLPIPFFAIIFASMIDIDAVLARAILAGSGAVFSLFAIPWTQLHDQFQEGSRPKQGFAKYYFQYFPGACLILLAVTVFVLFSLINGEGISSTQWLLFGSSCIVLSTAIAALVHFFVNSTSVAMSATFGIAAWTALVIITSITI